MLSYSSLKRGIGMKDWLKNKTRKVNKRISNMLGKIVKLVVGIWRVNSIFIGLALGVIGLSFAFGFTLAAFGVSGPILSILVAAFFVLLGSYGAKYAYDGIMEKYNFEKAKEEPIQKYTNNANKTLDYAFKRTEGIDVALDQDGKRVIVESLVPISEDELLEYLHFIRGKSEVRSMQCFIDMEIINSLKEQLIFVKNKDEAERLKRLVMSLEFKLQDTISEFNEYASINPLEAYDSVHICKNVKKR